jgi:hypothetical protein
MHSLNLYWWSAQLVGEEGTENYVIRASVTGYRLPGIGDRIVSYRWRVSPFESPR